ncbi:MAG TPA: CDP-archaeol synthase [Thiohalobacter sp.]|nr:CDP-archaeol synthase [Thiohalobacter sp.]
MDPVPPPSLVLLLLLMAANGAPILAQRLLGRHLDWPLDGGLVLSDHQRLLGRSKTLRGVVSALLLTPIAALGLGEPAWLGGLVALGAMLGDALSSFVKRRLGRPASSQALGLDQIPEALLPLLLVREHLQLDVLTITLLVVAFLILELLLSKLLYRLRIRRRPY